MAGTFDTWWNAIKAGVGTSIDGKTIGFYADGQEGQFEKGNYPALNYRFVDDTYGPAKSARGGHNGADPIWTCSTRIGMHVWGKDAEQVHELRRRLILALHTACRGHQNYRLEAGTWNTGGDMSHGVKYVFATIWDIPIVRDAEVFAVIETMTNDVGIEEPTP